MVRPGERGGLGTLSYVTMPNPGIMPHRVLSKLGSALKSAANTLPLYGLHLTRFKRNRFHHDDDIPDNFLTLQRLHRHTASISGALRFTC